MTPEGAAVFAADGGAGATAGATPAPPAAARWWDREELRAALAADEVRLPPPYTIGTHAISAWLAED